MAVVILPSGDGLDACYGLLPDKCPNPPVWSWTWTSVAPILAWAEFGVPPTFGMCNSCKVAREIDLETFPNRVPVTYTVYPLEASER